MVRFLVILRASGWPGKLGGCGRYIFAGRYRPRSHARRDCERPLAFRGGPQLTWRQGRAGEGRAAAAACRRAASLRAAWPVGVAHRLRLLGGEVVELGIAVAGRLGDDVPFDRLGRRRRACRVRPSGCAPAGPARSALPRRAALRNSRAAAVSSLAVPVPLNCAMANSTMASRLPATAASSSRRAASRWSFGTPRPSLYMVASAYCASGLPASAACWNSSAARMIIQRELLALQIEQAEIVSGGRMYRAWRRRRAGGRLRPGCAVRRGLRS